MSADSDRPRIPPRVGGSRCLLVGPPDPVVAFHDEGSEPVLVESPPPIEADLRRWVVTAETCRVLPRLDATAPEREAAEEAALAWCLGNLIASPEHVVAYRRVLWDERTFRWLVEVWVDPRTTAPRGAPRWPSSAE